MALIEVTYGFGHSERYVVPLVQHAEGSLSDALENDELARRLLTLIRKQATQASTAGALKGEALPRPVNLMEKLSPEPKLRRLGVEQTNTSLVFDDRVILKVVRKVEPGLNPEFEVGRFLATGGFAHSPALLGALRLEGPGEATIALLHDFVVGDGDDPSAVTLLEVNTLPGMTATSLYPEAMARSGFDFRAMCDALVAAALGRGGRRAVPVMKMPA